MSVLTTDVLIAGAGPVGLSIALDLAARGVRVTVAEIRSYGEPPSVKCNHVSSRTMERFRQLGIANDIRAQGLPDDYPNDVVFRTSMTGTELSRIRIPNRLQRFTAKEGPDGHWETPEPPHRINQIYLEPILLHKANQTAGITLLNRHQVTGFIQNDDQVTATVLDLNDLSSKTIQARFVIGCDGGASTVRRAIGSRLQGDPVVQNVQSTYIRAPQLKSLLQAPYAWGYYSVNERRCGTVFAIDGQDHWLIHNHLNPHETSFDAVDRDWSIRQILGVGDDFEYEIVSKEDWVGRRLVADRFREGNVFIAGDAAHLWVPYAGYGMNAGIADGLNLSWLLASYLQGWADKAMLDAYEQERLPITEQVSRFAMGHAAKMIKARGAVPAGLEAPDAAGQALRAQVGQAYYDTNVQQFCCAGLNYGYYYDQSSIIVYDGETPPEYSMGDYTASTVPGCRLPHLWLDANTSLYDALGPGYTLVAMSADAGIAALQAAANARGIPLKVLQLDPSQHAVPATYTHHFVICRPDQHVVWRGQSLPAQPDGLLDKLSGRAKA
ncbi:MAG: FAD-dependent oxidoreductase [Comamonas sp.]